MKSEHDLQYYCWKNYQKTLSSASEAMAYNVNIMRHLLAGCIRDYLSFTMMRVESPPAKTDTAN